MANLFRQGLGDVFGIGPVVDLFLDRQIGEARGDAGLYFAVLHRDVAGGGEHVGQQLFQPGGVYFADDAGDGFARVGAGLRARVIAGVDGDEEGGWTTIEEGVDLHAKAADHRGGVGVALAPAAEAIGVSEEDELEEIIFARSTASACLRA